MDQILGLVDRFGIVIVFIGTFFEGEVFAIVGGFLVYRGGYSFEFMLALSFVGSYLGDMAVFLFARYFSDSKWIVKWTKRPRFARALRLVDRFQAYFVIVNRYIYGLRVPGLIALGLSSITVPRYLFLNLIGAGIWATLFTTIGYVFGHAIATVFARLEVIEDGVIIGIATLAAGIGLYLLWYRFGPGGKERIEDRRAEKQRAESEGS